MLGAPTISIDERAMQTRHALGLSFALLWACGGRSALGLFDELEVGSGEGGRSGPGATPLGGASSGGKTATGASEPVTAGAAHARGGAMSVADSAGGARAINGGQPGSGGNYLVGKEFGGWLIVNYNPAMGAPAPPAKEFYSIWADGPERAWFVEETLGAATSRNLRTWQNGVLSTEVAGCGWTVRGGAFNDLWLAGCTAGLMHKGTAWSADTTRHGNWVWENAPNDLWSCCEATDNGSPYSAFNWDGSSWTRVELPSTDYKGGALWSAGPHDLWIADRDVLHWNGTAWSIFNNPGVGSWRDVWGDGANVWAVGSNTAIARWDGSNFEAIPTQPNGELEGVWGRPNDVWFVGLFGAIFHWDGAKITPVASPVIANLFGVWGAGDVLWVTGSQETLLRRKLDAP